jgi:hypothetical protein
LIAFSARSTPIFAAKSRSAAAAKLALGEAVDLDGGEVGEHRGPLQAFLMWTERPSAVPA